MKALLWILVGILVLLYPAAILFNFAALAIYLFLMPLVAAAGAGAAAAMHQRGRIRLRNGFLAVAGIATALSAWLFTSMRQLPFGH